MDERPMTTYDKTLGHFADEVFGFLAITPTTAGRLGFARIAVYEGCFDATAAGRWNPINSSQQFGKSTSFNGDGVQDYSSFTNGVHGTTLLLQGERWRGVVAAFRWAPTSAAVLAEFAIVYRDWGDTVPPGVTITDARATAALAETLPK